MNCAGGITYTMRGKEKILGGWDREKGNRPPPHQKWFWEAKLKKILSTSQRSWNGAPTGRSCGPRGLRPSFCPPKITKSSARPCIVPYISLLYINLSPQDFFPPYALAYGARTVGKNHLLLQYTYTRLANICRIQKMLLSDGEVKNRTEKNGLALAQINTERDCK